jgi:ferredoxin-NADP reductase
MAALMAAGSLGAVWVLVGRRGARRRVAGRVAGLRRHPALKVLEVDIQCEAGWAGHQPGQFAFVTLHADEGPHPYTLSSAWQDSGHLTIIVKALGDYTDTLAERVRVGDTLTALEPTGEFTPGTDAHAQRHLVLVAGGVGITPLISIAETVLRAEPASRVTLLTGNRSEEEIVFRARLDALAIEFQPRLVVRHALDVAPPGWNGLHGALDGARVVGALDLGAADAFYVCGPEPMMQSVCAALESAGVPRDRIHTERFAYASAATTRIPGHSAAITFATSGRRVTARAGQTLLQAGLEAGVDLPSSCTMGGCGACKVHKRAGTVVMSEPNCLGDHERDAGYVLACCTYAETDVVIDGF